MLPNHNSFCPFTEKKIFFGFCKVKKSSERLKVTSESLTVLSHLNQSGELRKLFNVLIQH